MIFVYYKKKKFLCIDDLFLELTELLAFDVSAFPKKSKILAKLQRAIKSFEKLG